MSDISILAAVLAVVIEPAGRMRPAHPRWAEFKSRLDEAIEREGCSEQRHAAAILRTMGFTERDVKASCQFLAALGGGCDCDIVDSVEHTYAWALDRLTFGGQSLGTHDGLRC